MQTHRLNPSAGLSLTEILVALAIVGTLLALALPAAQRKVERHRVFGTSESLRSDFQEARMLALGTGRSVRMRFVRTPTGVCALTYQGSADGCTCNERGEAVCSAGGQLIRNTWVASAHGIDVTTTASRITLEGQLGLVTPATTIRVTGRHGQRIDHVVAMTGRVRSCGLGEAALSRCPA